MRTELNPREEVCLIPRGLAGDLEAWSIRVVSLVEIVRLWIFRRSVALFMLVTLLSALLLPYRQAVSGGALTRASIVAGAVAAAAALVLAFSRAAYRLLSRSRVAQAVPALLAAALLSVVFPLHSQLWVPACGALCLLALFVSLREIVAIDLLVLLANLAAHAIAGDLGDVRPVAVIGLWVGIPFWTILFSVANERILDRILDLCLAQPAAVNVRGLRVGAWIARSRRGLPARSVSSQEAVDRVAERLTFEQKQVMVLLIGGFRNYEIATLLGIRWEEEVSRLISRAVKSVGGDCKRKEQLVSMLAREWWNTGPAARAREYQPDFR